MEDLRELLRSDDEEQARWLQHLDALGPPEFAVGLPPPEDLPAVLLDLAVPHEDINDLVALLPVVEQSTALWWYLERCTHALVGSLGTTAGPLPLPPLFSTLGRVHRYFYVYVFLAVLPHVRAFHRAHHIPEDVSRLTLADLGRVLTEHRLRHGVGGLDEAPWLTGHFRGSLYALGRLQFQRATLGRRTGRAIQAAGLPFGPGDPVLGVHVPAFSGPLTPRACDLSFARARAFFAQHFPTEHYAIAACHSWLLDEQLAEYLPAESNILQFQRRFQAAYRPDTADEDILQFVFGRRTPDLDDLPRRTTLERAVVDHLRAGRHWTGGAGWLRL